MCASTNRAFLLAASTKEVVKALQTLMQTEEPGNPVLDSAHLVVVGVGEMLSCLIDELDKPTKG